jgi:hypothetical protein
MIQKEGVQGVQKNGLINGRVSFAAHEEYRVLLDGGGESATGGSTGTGVISALLTFTAVENQNFEEAPSGTRSATTS